MAGQFQRLTGSAKAALAKGIDIARNLYAQKYSAQNIVTRDLAPSDFTITNTQKAWSFTGFSSGTGNTANAIINVTIRDNQFLVINGVSLPSSSTITQVDLSTGGRTERFWNVEYAQAANQDRSTFFTDPLIVRENNNLTINGFTTATGTLTCIFHGAAVEAPGLVVAGKC